MVVALATFVKVQQKGIIVLPRSLRERAGIKEGMLLRVEVRNGEMVLRPVDLWSRVWGCAKGKGSLKDLEREGA